VTHSNVLSPFNALKASSPTHQTKGQPKKHDQFTQSLRTKSKASLKRKDVSLEFTTSSPGGHSTRMCKHKIETSLHPNRIITQYMGLEKQLFGLSR